MSEKSEICKFYASKKILVTGSTGFMGKVLIWKLLHSCSEVDTIYVLMRSKYGKSSMSRRNQLFGSPIFDNFKKSNPEILQKVVVISGDVGEKGIGLSDEDQNMFIGDVAVIFHGAAILKMNADLRTAVNINTAGTVRLLDLAQKMKKLEAFVYVSTAYCCCENTTVEEIIYPAKHNPYDIINLTNWMEPEMLAKITPKLIDPLPNTYTYSKRLAEAVLQGYESKVPIIVARPTIVVPCFKEPLPGWCDSLNGAGGFLIAGARGVLRTLMLDQETKCDVIPADMAINSILILPWANPKEQLLKQISVYNISQNTDEVWTWGKITNLFINLIWKYPLNSMLWYPATKNYATKSAFIYRIKLIFLHYLPAYIIDFILLLVGQKPFLVNVHDRLTQGEKMLRYFTLQSWSFAHDNVLQVEKQLNDTDKEIFTVNMNKISSYEDFIDDMYVSAKIHLFKEDMNKLGQARIVLNIMYVLDKIVVALKYYLILRFLIYVFNTVLNIFE